jgi:hypothetical protein
LAAARTSAEHVEVIGPTLLEPVDSVASVASVADCLDLPVLRAGRLRGGRAGLDARVRWASSAADWRGCAPGEFRIVARLDDAAAVSHAAGAGAAALGASRVAATAAAAADVHALPVVELPPLLGTDDVAAELLDYVIASLDATVAAMHRVSARLAAAACADLRVESVAEALAAVIGAPVLVEDAEFRMIAAVGEGRIDENRAATIRAGGTPARFRATVAMRRFYERVAASSGPALLAPVPEIGLQLPRLVAAVRAAGEVMGYVTVIPPAGPDGRRISTVALEQAVHLVALAIVHGRAVELHGRITAGHLLLDLLEGGAPTSLVEARAAQLGVDLGVARAVAVVALPADARSEQAVRRAAGALPQMRAPLADVLGGRLVLLVEDGDRLAAVDRVREATGGGIALVGRCVTTAELPRAYDEVRRALDMAERAGRTATLDAAELGLVGLLLAGTADGALERFATHRLDALAAHDRREGADLCGSVAAFLDAGGLRAAARALSIHPNTLAYRLERAEAVGGFRLDSPDDRLELALALRCRRLLGS